MPECPFLNNDIICCISIDYYLTIQNSGVFKYLLGNIEIFGALLLSLCNRGSKVDIFGESFVKSR